MNVFYAESPLQLICMSQFIKEDDLLILRPTSSSTQQQLIETMNCLKLDGLRVKIFSGNNKIKRLYALLISLTLSIFYRRSTWHIGYFRSKLAYYILKMNPRRKLYIYDDGGATLSVIKEINWEKFFNIKYRTIFAVDDVYYRFVEKITLDKRMIKQTSKPALSLEHIFIGTKLVEIGKLSLDDYLDTLKKLRKLKNVKHYLQHRDESIDKINIIKSLGFEIVSINVPFELAILSNQLNVKQVYGVLTTVLLTSRLALGITSFYVTMAEKIHFQQERAYNFENALETLNIQLVKL